MNPDRAAPRSSSTPTARPAPRRRPHRHHGRQGPAVGFARRVPGVLLALAALTSVLAPAVVVMTGPVDEVPATVDGSPITRTAHSRPGHLLVSGAAEAGRARPGQVCDEPGCGVVPSPTPEPPPASTAPAVPSGPVNPNPGPTPALLPCAVFDLGGCVAGVITTFLRATVSEALTPLLALLSDTLLSTPTPASVPRLMELWNGSWAIVGVCYGLLVLAAGILLMGYETLQTRYALREIAPRVVIGFLAGALSMAVATMAIDLANALTTVVLGAGLQGADTTASIGAVITAAVSSDTAIFLLLLQVVVLAVLLALLLTYLVRVAITILLIAAAPVVLMFHALPHTEGIARWWWRTFGACLAIQLAQSLTLVTALRVLFTPDRAGVAILGQSSDQGLVMLLALVAVLWILYKIPFWLLSASRISHGHSMIGSLLRSYLTYKTFGLLRGRRRGGGGGGAPHPKPPPRPQPPPAPPPPLPPSPPDPYAQASITRQGQLMLPLGRLVRRHPPSPTPPPPRDRRPAGAGTQLEFPLAEGDWPEHRPRLGANGQYRLPLDVTRVPRPARNPARSAGGRTGTRPQPGPRPTPRQLTLPLAEGDWPEHRPQLGRDGQYRLPLNVRRTPPPPPRHTPAPPTPRPARPAAGQQLPLPFDPPDPYARIRPLRNGQFPLPLPGVTRRPRPTPPARTPATPPAVPPNPPPARPHGRQLALDFPHPPPPPRSTPPRPAAPPTARPTAPPVVHPGRAAAPSGRRPVTGSGRPGAPPPVSRPRATPPTAGSAVEPPTPVSERPAARTNPTTGRPPRRRPSPPPPAVSGGATTGDDPT